MGEKQEKIKKKNLTGDVMIPGHPCTPAKLRNSNMGNPSLPREEF